MPVLRRELLGEGSANAAICQQCSRKFVEQMQPVSEEYLARQAEFRLDLEVQDADIAGHLLEPEDRRLFYGCWFGTYPVWSESQLFCGMQFSDLFIWGVHLIGPLTTTRLEVQRFLDRYPVPQLNQPVSADLARQMTIGIILDDGQLLSDDECVRIAQLRPWILDVTLVRYCIHRRPV